MIISLKSRCNYLDKFFYMLNEIILTIGIPTFNGAKYLSFAVESAIREIPKGEEKKYEILISDNASTDNTKQLVLDLQKLYPNQISYVCNKTNVGYDRNLNLLIKKSKGKYVKLLGDDDELMPNSIKRITDEILKNPNLVAIVHSVKFLDINTNKFIESDHKVPTTKVYKNGDEFFQESKWSTAAFASLVICKLSWENSNIEKYIDSKWIHLGGLIEILKKQQENSMGISDQLVIVRLNNDRWSDNFRTILEAGINRTNVMRNLLDTGYDKKTFRVFQLMQKEEHSIDDLVKIRSDSFYENIKRSLSFIKEFWRFPKFCVILVPTLLWGDNFVRFIRKIKNNLK